MTATQPVDLTTASSKDGSPIENVKPSDGLEKGQLLTSCLEVLSRAYPKGLTARELVDELAKEDASLELTSSLLSSKLNAVFRKLHNERGEPTREQLQELPMTRRMTEDKRKRLIYHYVPAQPQTPDSGDEKVESDESKDESSDEVAEEPKEDPHKPPVISEPSPEVSDLNSKSKPSEPISPVTPTSPKRKLEEKPEPRKKHAARNVKSFNPYYDTITLHSLPVPQLVTAPQSPATWGDDLNDLEAPETIDLDDLDNCF